MQTKTVTCVSFQEKSLLVLLGGGRNTLKSIQELILVCCFDVLYSIELLLKQLYKNIACNQSVAVKTVKDISIALKLISYNLFL